MAYSYYIIIIISANNSENYGLCLSQRHIYGNIVAYFTRTFSGNWFIFVDFGLKGKLLLVTLFSVKPNVVVVVAVVFVWLRSQYE